MNQHNQDNQDLLDDLERWQQAAADCFWRLEEELESEPLESV